VLVYRHPLEVAHRLSRYGTLTLSEWISVWENYTVGALKGISRAETDEMEPSKTKLNNTLGCEGMPKIIVAQSTFGVDPYGTLLKVYQKLKEHVKYLLIQPNEEDVKGDVPG